MDYLQNTSDFQSDGRIAVFSLNRWRRIPSPSENLRDKGGLAWKLF